MLINKCMNGKKENKVHKNHTNVLKLTFDNDFTMIIMIY